MADLHRKTLTKSDPRFVVIITPCPTDDCDHDLHPPPPPPPPPPPSASNDSLSPFLIFLFCGLAVSFLFICYLTLAARYRRRQTNDDNSDETHEDFVNEDLGPVIHHPIWFINTIGLEQSEIESIHVFKYRKDEGLVEGTDCSVCLSEFEDDESLRLLPKCSHAFHVPCIDTWLRSHKNCPLCRAPIIKNTIPQTETTPTDSNSIEPLTTEESSPPEDSETADHDVVEVENNSEAERTFRIQSDLVDRHRVHEEPVDKRRSISMDESSASVIHLAVSKFHLHDQETHSRNQSVLHPKKPNNVPKTRHKRRGSSSSAHIRSKSSSSGHSFRKASSFTNKLRKIDLMDLGGID